MPIFLYRNFRYFGTFIYIGEKSMFAYERGNLDRLANGELKKAWCISTCSGVMAMADAVAKECSMSRSELIEIAIMRLCDGQRIKKARGGEQAVVDKKTYEKSVLWDANFTEAVGAIEQPSTVNKT